MKIKNCWYLREGCCCSAIPENLCPFKKLVQELLIKGDRESLKKAEIEVENEINY